MVYAPVISSDTLAASVSKLNDAFDLLLGHSHGSTAPSSPEAWQSWLDTTTSNSTMKIRNATNDGWISTHWLESPSGPIAGDGTNIVKLLAPASLTASYTLTLPNSTELPSSGTKYLLVDSTGTITFSATGP